MVQNQAKELAEARENIAQIQRVFQKIQQLIRIKLELNKRRDAILEGITISGNKPGNVERLKPVLERERKVLKIIINEEDIETSNIYIAEQILTKFRKLNKKQKRAMEAELNKLGIKFSDLEAIAILAIEILQKSKNSLKEIKKRIEKEEKLIKNPTYDNLSAFRATFGLEKSMESQLMEYIQIKVNQNRIRQLSSILDEYIRVHRTNPLNFISPGFIAIMALSEIVSILALFAKEASYEMAQIIPKEKNIFKALRRTHL